MPEPRDTKHGVGIRVREISEMETIVLWSLILSLLSFDADMVPLWSSEILGVPNSTLWEGDLGLLKQV